MAKEAIKNPPVKVEVKPEVKVEKPAPETKVKLEEKPVAPQAQSVDYSSKTVAELRDIAKEKNLTGYSSLKKAELIELLENN
ncbi:MAG: Rho termination factor N-terminal domain-containing protein [Acholeplasmataceae bacterium]